MNIKKINKGFTLIELIIVISIIAILSAAAIPEYNYYIEKAKKTKVVTIGRQLFMSSMSSFSEEGGTFNKDKLLDTFKTTIASVSIPESKLNIITSKLITIDFTQDNKEYRLSVNADSNNFTINCGGTEIYKSD